jgi:aminoglycoside phosphotransferase (APT) family kinase protein
LAGELDEARAALDGLAPLAPGLAASLHRSLRDVDGGALDQPGRLGPAHGDFRPSQVLFDGPTTGLLGFDRACLAEPALDLGTFTAHLCAAVPPGTDPQTATRTADRLVALALRGYLEAGGAGDADALAARVADHRTVALVRLAVRRWCRFQPERLRSVLDRLDARQRSGVS